MASKVQVCAEEGNASINRKDQESCRKQCVPGFSLAGSLPGEKRSLSSRLCSASVAQDESSRLLFNPAYLRLLFIDFLTVAH